MSDLDVGDLEDLAAELDDDDNDPAGDDAGADPQPGASWFTGFAEGGPQPYPGKLLVSRYPKGVLLVDMPTARAWVYDYDGAGGIFRCRDDAGAPLDPAGRWRAAEGPNYEVRAYDEAFGGDEPPTCPDPAGPACPDPGVAP